MLRITFTMATGLLAPEEERQGPRPSKEMPSPEKLVYLIQGLVGEEMGTCGAPILLPVHIVPHPPACPLPPSPPATRAIERDGPGVFVFMISLSLQDHLCARGGRQELSSPFYTRGKLRLRGDQRLPVGEMTIPKRTSVDKAKKAF